MEAGNNITLQDGSSISDGNNWSVNLEAGYVNNAISYGQGSILLNGGSGSIQTATGNINLEAGQDILVGSGYVITTAAAASAPTPSREILTPGPTRKAIILSTTRVPSARLTICRNGLGGISTAAGGDVTLIAGGNVTSVLPGKGVYYLRRQFNRARQRQ